MRQQLRPLVLYTRPGQVIVKLAFAGLSGLLLFDMSKAVVDTHKEYKAREAEIDQIRDRIDVKLTNFSKNGFNNASEAYAVAHFEREAGFSISGDRDFQTSSVTEISENGKKDFVLQAPIDPLKAKMYVDEAAGWAKGEDANSRLITDLKQLDKVLVEQPRPDAAYRSAIPYHTH